VANLKVIGTGSYLPEKIIDNSYFEDKLLKRYDVNGEVVGKKRITSDGIYGVTGIRERREAMENEWPSDLGYKAVVRALDDASVSADSLVGIIVSTISEKSNFPSAACKIQERLGIKECVSYDIAAACAGFPLALGLANSSFNSNKGNYAVVGSECLRRISDKTDINDTLFGDGAGAVILTPTEESIGFLGGYIRTSPLNGMLNWIFRDKNDYLKMPEGERVMKAAIRGMLDTAHTIEERLGLGEVGCDVYIPHQANGRILDRVASKVEKKGGKVYRNIENFGNMSSATIPVALDFALKEGFIEEGNKVMLTAVGAGLVASAAAIQF